jgi:hypothetical protein
VTEVERTGWWLDYRMDMWMNGRNGIGVEIIAGWPREQVQQYAIARTGEPLPDEAFSELDDMARDQPSIKNDARYALSRPSTT